MIRLVPRDVLNRCWVPTGAWLAVLCLSGPAAAQEPPPRSPEIDLLAGDSLDAWRISGCRATLQDGVLTTLEGDGLIRTQEKFVDFELHLEWRPLQEEKWDAGVFIRCGDPPPGRPWPRKHQINLKQNEEGTLIGDPDARCAGLARPGQWNALEVIVRGDRATLKVNGQTAWTDRPLDSAEGYIALQVETPLGGKFQYRRIRVRRIPSPQSP